MPALKKAALLSIALLLPSAALRAIECPEPLYKIVIDGTGAWAKVVKNVASYDRLNLPEDCFVDSAGLFRPAEAPDCARAINAQIANRYKDTKLRILESYKKLGAISISSPLDCGNDKYVSQSPPPVTKEPFGLDYLIAPSTEKQEDSASALYHKLKVDSAGDKDLATSLPRLSLGRGSAEDYQRAVNRLACLYPAKFDNPEDAHKFLAEIHLGIDCAGAVQVMLHHATDTTANKELGLNFPADESFRADLMKRRHKDFEYNKDPLSMRPGDIIPLDAPKGVGHVVVVQDVQFSIAKGNELGPAGDVLLTAQVASSWGHDNGGHGPEIQTWVYDAQTKKWATQHADGTLTLTPNGPYNHYYSGQFRSAKLPGSLLF